MILLKESVQKKCYLTKYISEFVLLNSILLTEVIYEIKIHNIKA